MYIVSAAKDTLSTTQINETPTDCASLVSVEMYVLPINQINIVMFRYI